MIQRIKQIVLKHHRNQDVSQTKVCPIFQVPPQRKCQQQHKNKKKIEQALKTQLILCSRVQKRRGNGNSREKQHEKEARPHFEVIGLIFPNFSMAGCEWPRKAAATFFFV
jgi:hypothetical protein